MTDQKIMRKKRLNYLFAEHTRLKLMNYPWGLDRFSNEYIQRANAIRNELRDAGLYAKSTLNRDINVNNLIVEVQTMVRKWKRTVSTASKEKRLVAPRPVFSPPKERA